MNHLTDALNSFKCCKDIDIENFLHTKAIEFNHRKWCHTYLIVDEDEFDNGHIRIDAYFTLSHKSIIPNTASKSSIKETSGFVDTKSIHFVLIGQLGKYIEQKDDGYVISANISGAEILDYALEIIASVNELIPCRCALVECSDNKKVQDVYLKYGFSYFQKDDIHHQFYKRI